MGAQGLQFQTIEVTFNKGQENKTQRKLVAAGKWLSLKNVGLSSDYTLKKRDGVAAIAATAVGNGVATHNDELVLVNGPTVGSMSLNGPTPIARTVTGKLGYLEVRKSEVNRGGGRQDSMDVAYGAGYTCYVWMELGGVSNVAWGIHVTLRDESTGTTLLFDTRLSSLGTEICPRVVYDGVGAFYVFWMDATGTPTLFCSVIQTASPTSPGSQTPLVSDANLRVANFDAMNFGGSGIGVMVAYPWKDGTTSVRGINVTRTGSIPSILTGPTNLISNAQLAYTDIGGISVAAFTALKGGAFVIGPDAIWCVTFNTNTVIIQSALNLGVLGGGVPSHITAVLLASGQMQVFWDGAYILTTPTAATAVNPIRYMIVSPLLGLNSTGTTVNSANFNVSTASDPIGPTGPWICGKAFTYFQTVILPVCVSEAFSGYLPGTARVTQNEQNTVFFMDATHSSPTSPVYVGKALYGSAGVAAHGYLDTAPAISTPCSTPSVGTGLFAMAMTELTALVTVNGVNLSPTSLVRLTMEPRNTKAPVDAQLGESTYFAGGSLSAYDGVGVVEHGFPLFPEGVSATVTTGSGSVSEGVHQLVAIYEWLDNAGQRHQSAPSQAVSVTIAPVASKISVTAPSLLLSQKPNVNIVWYLTAAGGTTFYRFGTALLGANGTANDLTAAKVTSPDILLADAAFTSNEVLYTQPGTPGTPLPNLSPGPSAVLGLHQNRVWADITDQPGMYTLSQPYVNNVGLHFNPALNGLVGAGAGEIRGFRTMDEKQIILCAEKLFVVYGQGPNQSGGFSTYGEPQVIPSDVGCSEARSILSMPNGVIFKSVNGWQLLGRDLVVRFIGGAVTDYNNLATSSAVLVGAKQECRFSTADSTTALVYAYDVDQWSVTQYFTGDTSYLVNDATWWSSQDLYVQISLGQGLNKDTPNSYIDSPGALGPFPIPWSGTTSFIHLATLEGYQRVRWLYLTATADDSPVGSLNVQVDYDDGEDESAPGSYNFDISLASLSKLDGMPLDFRHKLRRQKCKSVSFTFAETPAGTGSQPQMTGIQAIALQIGVKRGTNKLKASQGVG